LPSSSQNATQGIAEAIAVNINRGEAVHDSDIAADDLTQFFDSCAKSIAYGDPAKGGAVPVYFVSLLQRLGIAEEAKAKTKLVAPGETPQAVATGEAELGIVQASELVSVRGVELLGPFPTELQLYTILAAGIASNSKEPEAASALIKLLTAPAAASVLMAKGMEPG
jgi:molybdate transport system substrate-binding protein